VPCAGPADAATRAAPKGPARLTSALTAIADETTIAELRTQLQVLITYAQASKPELQREVAERLANEAVKGASMRRRWFLAEFVCRHAADLEMVTFLHRACRPASTAPFAPPPCPQLTAALKSSSWAACAC